MHDPVWFEVNSAVSSYRIRRVVDAAEKQAIALGLPEIKASFVPHPIQDATDDEMQAKADAIIDRVIAALKK